MVLQALATGTLLKTEANGFLSIESFSAPIAENFNYTSSSDTAILVQSTGQSRDMEVSLTARPANATVFLRYDGTKAIYFRFNGASLLHIGLASGISGQSYSTPASTFARIYQDVGTSTGTIVCGVAGVEIYVKVNGTKVVSFKDRHIVQAGYAIVKAANGQTVAGTTTFLPITGIYSTPSTNTWDIRDFGASTATTTGSINASSTSLTVANASQFAVGDHVIVEIGNEAGAGVRGTAGVGGTWPALSYANSTARTADTGQINGKWAYQIDTGNCYQWSTGSPGSWRQETGYYIAKAVPRSLFARITAKSGDVLTLNTAATVTATNANVYFDNTTKITNITQSIYYNGGLNGNGSMSAFETSQAIVYIPTGTFWCAAAIITSSNLQFKGAGATSIIRAAKGCSGGIYIGGNATGEVANNFKIIGNITDNGFGLAWGNLASNFDGVDSTGSLYFHNDDPMTETSSAFFPRGVAVTGATGATVRNVDAVDVFYQGVGFSSCHNCWGINISETYTQGLREYIGWALQMADSNGGGLVNATVSCAGRMVAGIELFRCTGSVITTYTGTNASMSSNSSGAFTYTDCNITVTVTDNDENITAFSPANPLININDNIGGGYVTQGGSIINATMTQAARADASNNSFRGIVVNATNQDVTITGGSYSAPDYLAPSTMHGAAGIISTAHNTDVSNFTVVGKAKHEVAGSGYRNIDLQGGSGSSATGCTANEIYVNP